MASSGKRTVMYGPGKRSGNKDVLLVDRFLFGERIGRGSFGVIYAGTDLHTGRDVAIKMESRKSQHPQLKYEYKIVKWFEWVAQFPKYERYKSIKIPQVLHYGTLGSYYVMVMSLLGPSLEDLFAFCGRRFSLKTVCMLGYQLVCQLMNLHGLDFIHRDVKPENFLLGAGNHSRASTVHLVDFGLARRYRDKQTSQHIPYCDHAPFLGTARYASCNQHFGIAQTRRDDLESIGYMLVYFANGSLPWQGSKGGGRPSRLRAISQVKTNMSISELCRGLPAEFEAYFKHIRALRYDERPDYRWLRRLFLRVLKKHGHSYDLRFDWCDPALLAEKFDKRPARLEAWDPNTHEVIDENDLQTRSQKSGGKPRRSDLQESNTDKEITNRDNAEKKSTSSLSTSEGEKQRTESLEDDLEFLVNVAKEHESNQDNGNDGKSQDLSEPEEPETSLQGRPRNRHYESFSNKQGSSQTQSNNNVSSLNALSKVEQDHSSGRTLLAGTNKTEHQSKSVRSGSALLGPKPKGGALFTDILGGTSEFDNASTTIVSENAVTVGVNAPSNPQQKGQKNTKSVRTGQLL